MNIHYRDARKEDSLRLAELDSIASGGAIDYLFHDLIPNRSPIEIVAENYGKDGSPHSYQNATVAECQGQVIGMSLSFPGSYHRITTEMIELFPREKIAHFKAFFSVPVATSYFLDALCVEDPFRRKGVGQKLVKLTRRKAAAEGYDSLSLLAWRDNTDAIRFYEKVGFRDVLSVPLQSHELMPHEGGCVLMTQDI